MSRQHYPEEFKIEAVKHVTEKGKSVAYVAQRLRISVPWATSFYCLSVNACRRPGDISQADSVSPAHGP